MGMTYLPDFMRREGPVRILGHKSNGCLVSTYGQQKAVSDSTCVQPEMLQVAFPRKQAATTVLSSSSELSGGSAPSPDVQLQGLPCWDCPDHIVGISRLENQSSTFLFQLFPAPHPAHFSNVLRATSQGLIFYHAVTKKDVKLSKLRPIACLC